MAQELNLQDDESQQDDSDDLVQAEGLQPYTRILAFTAACGEDGPAQSLQAQAGATVTLSWELSGDATAITIEGVSQDLDPSATSVDVTVDQDTDFVLHVDSECGSDQMTASVAVHPEDQCWSQHATVSLPAPASFCVGDGQSISLSPPVRLWCQYDPRWRDRRFGVMAGDPVTNCRLCGNGVPRSHWHASGCSVSCSAMVLRWWELLSQGQFTFPNAGSLDEKLYGPRLAGFLYGNAQGEVTLPDPNVPDVDYLEIFRKASAALHDQGAAHSPGSMWGTVEQKLANIRQWLEYGPVIIGVYAPISAGHFMVVQGLIHDQRGEVLQIVDPGGACWQVCCKENQGEARNQQKYWGNYSYPEAKPSGLARDDPGAFDDRDYVALWGDALQDTLANPGVHLTSFTAYAMGAQVAGEQMPSDCWLCAQLQMLIDDGTIAAKIRRGGNQGAIQLLQWHLVKLGYDLGSAPGFVNGIDGGYGDKTEQARLAFCAAAGVDAGKHGVLSAEQAAAIIQQHSAGNFTPQLAAAPPAPPPPPAPAPAQVQQKAAPAPQPAPALQGDDAQIAQQIVARVSNPLPEPSAAGIDALPEGIYVQLWLNDMPKGPATYSGEPAHPDRFAWLQYHCDRLRNIGVTGVVLHDGGSSICTAANFPKLAAAVNPDGATALQILCSWYVTPGANKYNQPRAEDIRDVARVAAFDACAGVILDAEVEWFSEKGQKTHAPEVLQFLEAIHAAMGDAQKPVLCQPLWNPSYQLGFPYCEFDAGIDAWTSQFYAVDYPHTLETDLHSAGERGWWGYNREWYGMGARQFPTIQGYGWQRKKSVADIFKMLSLQLELRPQGERRIVFYCEQYASDTWPKGEKHWQKNYLTPHVEQAIATWTGNDYSALDQPVKDEYGDISAGRTSLSAADALQQQMADARASIAQWYAANPPAPPDNGFDFNLTRAGMSGTWSASVQGLQERLHALGFSKMSIDGGYGKQGESAVSALKDALIAMPDGLKNAAVRALTPGANADRNFWLALRALELAQS